jgi:hypothetical protein
MNKKLEPPVEAFGLLANGSSGHWDISVDESLGNREREWSLEIEGPQTYLVFRLADLQAIARALHYLESGLAPGQKGTLRKVQRAAETLGYFGLASVALQWDNEDFPRCFIIIGDEAGSTLRVSLDQEDITMFIEALRRVAHALPAASCDGNAENSAGTHAKLSLGSPGTRVGRPVK